MTTTRTTTRALAALALLAPLAACDVNKELPFGGSITMSPTEPLGGPVDGSNAEACVVRDDRGRPGLTARGRCEGDEDRVIRGR